MDKSTEIDELKQQSVRLDIKIKSFERFMIGVAKRVNCLPDFCEPELEKGNSHISDRLNKYNELAKLVAEGNFNQGRVIALARSLIK